MSNFGRFHQMTPGRWITPRVEILISILWPAVTESNIAFIRGGWAGHLDRVTHESSDAIRGAIDSHQEREFRPRIRGFEGPKISAVYGGNSFCLFGFISMSECEWSNEAIINYSASLTIVAKGSVWVQGSSLSSWLSLADALHTNTTTFIQRPSPPSSYPTNYNLMLIWSMLDSSKTLRSAAFISFPRYWLSLWLIRWVVRYLKGVSVGYVHCFVS